MTVITPIQVRFADTDMLGHVNNVNLQHYFDIGKYDYSHKVLGDELKWNKRSLIQKATNIVYEAQTRLGENIEVRTDIEKIGRTSVKFYQEIYNSDTGEIKAICHATLVGFDFELQETFEIPQSWRDRINS